MFACKMLGSDKLMIRLLILDFKNEQVLRLQQRDANTKESKNTVLESDNFPLRRSSLLFDNNL